MSINELMQRYAPQLKEVWSDVDGVMTPQASLEIYDLVPGSDLSAFKRVDGDRVMYMVPCDEYGIPVRNAVDYFAGSEESLVLEGYRFDTRDGKMVEYLTHCHYIPVYFISGRDSACVRVRAKKLGAVSFLGEKDKLSVIKSQTRVSLREILFFADGIQDVEAMQAIKLAGGITVAPADACKEAKAEAVYVSPRKGGEGVLDEVIGAFLKVCR